MGFFDKAMDFIWKQADKNNKYIDDVSAIQERRNLGSKSEKELKEMYDKTSDSKLRSAIRKELSERGC